jgi:hypothetical protein
MDAGLMRNRLIGLNAGEVLHLRDVAGDQILVVQGVAWVTQEGDPHDHVLERGDQFRFDRNGLALVTSMAGAAKLVVEAGSNRLPDAVRGRDLGPQRESGDCTHAVEPEARRSALRRAA